MIELEKIIETRELDIGEFSKKGVVFILNKKIYFYMNNLVKGGAERVIVQLAINFKKKGNDVKIITSFQDEDEYILPTTIERVNLEKKQDFGNRVIRNVRLIKKLRKIVKEEEPDILIAFMQEPNFRAILSTRFTKTKCLVSVRNDPKVEYAGFVGKIVSNLILPLADGCVFQTTDAKRYFSKSIQKKSRIIFNEVSELFFNVDHLPQKNIVTVGRIIEQKNQIMLINSFSKLLSSHNDRKLLIYGDGPLKKTLREYVKNIGLENYIYFMGLTDNVPDVLKKAELFVLTSNYEGLPNALLEALAVGVPSISTDCPCGGAKMVINNGENGFLIPVRNQEELTKKMRLLLDDKVLYSDFEIKSKESAKKFKPSIVFKEWEDYIENILERNNLK